MMEEGFTPGILLLAIRVLSAALLLSICAVTASAAQPQRPMPLKSGIDFASAEVRALQQDDFANPGMLWVARGEKLWQEPAGRENKACSNCHGAAPASMKGVATRYPRIDPIDADKTRRPSGFARRSPRPPGEGLGVRDRATSDGDVKRDAAQLINLEGRILQCRERRQQAAPLPHESDELLALIAYVAHQSRGMPMNVAIDLHNRRNFERGRELYQRRVGQMNLACAHCHDANWGKKLGAETISQGHPNAYPIYRLEWQTAGSLQRRFRSCLSGLRAEMLPYGAPEYLNLELYLAWRARGLPVETPGVRR